LSLDSIAFFPETRKTSRVADRTVLVVDDNPANRALAQGTLEDEGYGVLLAESGAEALALFEREQPDCVLLDVRMPGMDGFEVCKRIRLLPAGAETPIVFLTALRDVDTFDEALRAGGDDFLTKPVRPTELVVRVQAAMQLRKLRLELREHYDLLRHQRDDLMRLQLQKERLMSFIVHDLKNPVNSMDLHAQVLLRSKDLSGWARESVTQIRAEARQLTRLILNLLDLGKADEGKLTAQCTDVDLRALFDEVVNELEIAARGREVELVTEPSVESLNADPDLLRRMLANLLENAVRHAPANTRVTLSARNEGDLVALRVSDEGGGIPLELRQRIFEPFVQLDGQGGSGTTRGGRGLGLAFCKLVAEAHSGTIFVEDTPKGATICATFPP
jgi:two-component system, sensor histidine kinase and response regulator